MLLGCTLRQSIAAKASCKNANPSYNDGACAMPDALLDRTEINGHPATVEDMRAVALLNYGHFTSMQVRSGCVRGLDLHFARLEQATRELFGHTFNVDATRGYLRQIVGDDARALSLRVNVFSRALQRDRLNEPSIPDVLVSTSVARDIVPVPVRVRSVRYEREAPHIKHVGTFGLFQQKRLAQAAGFDDALFIDTSGAICEGSMWNVGFFDGVRVVWPNAPALDGVAMQLLKGGMQALGMASITRRVELAEIAAFHGAFFTNSSCVVLPVGGIDDVDYALDPQTLTLLAACMELAPWQRL